MTTDKKQRAFNRLLARVESLRRQLDERRGQLDQAMVLHAAQVAPRLREISDLRKQAVRALRPCLQDRRFSTRDRRLLAEFVAGQLDALFELEPVEDADLQELFEELHGVSVADVAQEQIDQSRAEMAEFFEHFGVDVEIPELRVGMSQEKLAASAASFMDEMQREFEDAASDHDAPDRPRTKRELREEAKARKIEEARRNSIGVVYKRLAKALHPDLEPDPEARERKGTLMQQVTAAHAANDLHTLLRLEIEVIHGDAADPSTLAAETLDAYTEMLKQQAAELEAERMELLFNPRYQPVVASGPLGPYGVIDCPAEADRLDTQLEGIRRAVSALSGADAFVHVQGLIAEERALRTPPPTSRGRRRRRKSRRHG